ncbi:MAG TPA: putative cytokinetic ring protein SteA [Actinomycetota bacterium]|nr:putative cytokinetic ring protein SteA [Actinomycetota bacterium]
MRGGERASAVRPRRRAAFRRPRPESGPARVDRRTKALLRRVRPGDVAVIHHEDLDRVSAEGLVAAGVAAVVNAAPSITGRYPNLGPLILLEAGIPLVDGVGELLLRKVREGDPIHVDGDRIYAGEALVGVGVRRTLDDVLAEMERAREHLGERFDSFARNTLEYLQVERDLLFGGMGLPSLRHDLRRRHVLVVVRGYGYREDLAALRPYIRDVRPILVGVDGGADALLDEGYVPDLIVGDMDSVSDRALELARPDPRGRAPTELVVHAYRDGRAPGRARLEALGLPYHVVEATGTSEDLAFLLAHEEGAELIVAVGTHGNLREFLDKGRDGMASTFLVRLRVGEILMDAKGVSRLYRSGLRRGDLLLLVGSAALAVVLVAGVSPAVRLYLRLVLDDLLFWLRGLL